MRYDRGNSAQNSLITATALRLGVTANAVYKYVIGVQYPAVQTIRKISEELHWSIEEQVRLIPDHGTYNLTYGMVLAEVMRENFPDIEPGFSGTYEPSGQPKYRPSAGGWTHGMVASRMDVRVANVTRWLNGDRYPEARTMLRIERIFGWPAAEQIQLILEQGYDDAYGTAFKAVLDRAFPLKDEV
ncbi:MAG: helix-turn-helix domain-containing protein [Arthrobacter sp.]